MAGKQNIFPQLNAVGSHSRIGFFVFWLICPSLEIVAERFAQELSFREAFAESAKAGDPYRRLHSAEEMKSSERTLRQRYEEIGVCLNASPTGCVKVLQVFEGSPAREAGLVAGDEIRKIDGLDLHKISLEETLDLLRGPRNAPIRVTILRASDGEIYEFLIRRRTIYNETVSNLVCLDEVSSYIRIREFAEQTTAEFEHKTANLASESLILDLRGNSGGLLSAACEIADRFVPKGALMLKIHRFGEPENEYLRAEHTTEFPKLKIAVLIDEKTASSAEVLAGILHLKCYAELIGQRSFGKGTIQSFYAFDGNGGAKFTTGEFYLPDGRRVEGFGLRPQVPVQNCRDSSSGSLSSLLEDECVQAAIELARSSSH